MSLNKPKSTIDIIVVQLKQKGKHSKSFTVYGISLEKAYKRARGAFKKLLNKNSSFIFNAEEFYEAVKKSGKKEFIKPKFKDSDFWNKKLSRETILQKMQTILDNLKKILESPAEGLIPSSLGSIFNESIGIMLYMIGLGALCDKMMELEKKE